MTQMKSSMRLSNYIVYKHTSPSGKIYIGITCQNVCKRWKNGKGYETCIAFYRAIQKYGWGNIRHEILKTGLTKEEACAEEQRLIRLYKSNTPDFGYNLTSGGEHYKQGIEAKKRLSASLKEYYRSHPEAKKRISDDLKKRKTSSATKRKMSKARKKYLTQHPEMKTICGNAKRGTHLSEEAKQKLREVNQKKVICNETGEVFDSVNDAANFVGKCKAAVSNNLSGRSHSCGGYSFSYI